MSKRVVASGMGLSAVALVALLVHEGYTDNTVVPTKGDVPTIGFGSTRNIDGTSVKLGDKTDPITALTRSHYFIQEKEKALRKCVIAPVNQTEYDIMLDFAYQYGENALCRSNIVKYINNGQYEKACDAYSEYRFMTDTVSHRGWEPIQFNSAGQPIKWRFDCSTPGNKICRGVWLRQEERIKKCKAAL